MSGNGCCSDRGPAGPVLYANHRILSRPPSRREPFRSERRDHWEKSVEKSIKFPSQIGRRIHRGFQRTDCAGTGRRHLSSRGVSDHVRGRRLDRSSGHFAWSLTPRDWCWRPLGHWRHHAAAQSAARERRPASCTTTCSCPAGSPPRSYSSTRTNPRRRPIQGEHLARRGCSPTVFPLDTFILAATMVVVVPVMDADQRGAHGGRGGPS